MQINLRATIPCESPEKNPVPVELGKLGSVALLGIVEIVHWACTEEESEHAANVATTDLMASVARRLQYALDELSSHLVEVSI